LAKDNAIQNAQAYGSAEAIREGRVPRVHGFDVYEYNDIPANGESLECIDGSREALIIAARQPANPANAPHVMIENAQEPVTGLPLQFRAWYDADSGVSKVSVGVLYGVAVGVAGNLRRIKSA
jgi:hypothetical protein